MIYLLSVARWAASFVRGCRFFIGLPEARSLTGRATVSQAKNAPRCNLGSTVKIAVAWMIFSSTANLSILRA
jgi:hypothetical protein